MAKETTAFGVTLFSSDDVTETVFLILSYDQYFKIYFSG